MKSSRPVPSRRRSPAPTGAAKPRPNRVPPVATRPAAAGSAGELAILRGRLAEAEETLRAIRSGEVDAVVVAGPHGPQVFTLQGAEHAYRVLIESMNEGALTLTPDGVILYANQCIARMLRCPLERVVGSCLLRFLSAGDQAAVRRLLNRVGTTGSKIQVSLQSGDGPTVPVQISTRSLARNGSGRATLGMVVTDMTESRRNEARLRALTQRVVQVQEVERGRVALELHDNITQHLCAVLFRSQVLADSLPARERATQREVKALRKILGTIAEEVERISRNLRPGVLEQLGLAAVLRDITTEFAYRTGLVVRLGGVQPATRLPPDIELALYRIVQEALVNVEKHARAHHVVVKLSIHASFVRLTVRDDGLGFDPDRRAPGPGGLNDVGLLGMRERAAYVGGTLKVDSVRGAGTRIEVRIPLVPAVPGTAT